jgi:hypothetical protein
MARNDIQGDPLDLSRNDRSFHISQYFTVAQSATAYFQIITGTREAFLFQWSLVAATQSCRFIALEAPTVTDGTTAITPRSINRDTSTATTLTLYSDPTSISGGTSLVDVVIPSGGNKTGGGASNHVYWTLKPSTDYVASVQNLGNSETICTFEMSWIELGP